MNPTKKKSYVRLDRDEKSELFSRDPLKERSRDILTTVYDILEHRLNLRVRTPAIFSSLRCVEVAWYPCVHILIYVDCVKCFDGASPMASLTVVDSELSIYELSYKLYSWLIAQHSLQDQFIPADASSDDDSTSESE